ncbi:DUF1800 domain-containing protein [Paludisphaera borealis]|uniref:DUF1800 domain-containing protein n=1 Tax=Paludisphaera borealis TaxID=1387353 RepID=A0A1U7CK61_9BACT|nr:DUF1800 domain-containing protein [Paludisphaera borealis]APW59296.1 hypothetical protein BSF38_00713 [Paludisphaera borealis]
MRQKSSKTQDRPAWDAGAAAHLLSRATFGGTPEEAARLAATPMERAVDSLLSEAGTAKTPARPAWVTDPWVNTERRFADTTREQAAESHRATRRRYASELNDLRAWSLRQMIAAPVPLREVMTLFWHGHFATAAGKVNLSQAMFQQDETLRRLALGDFRSLVREVTLSPAMMMYLDLEGSDKAKPNENYARELYELFTVGIGHYTERDIKETARALTGWTLDGPRGAAKTRVTAADTPRDFARDGLIATFVPERHDDGVKTIFGETGRFGLDDVVELILRQEATGRFLAAKLIDYFGAIDPDEALRGRMAEAFTASKGEIREMLRVLFTAPEFYAEAARGSLIKSPVRLLVGACRQLALDVEPTPTLAQLTAAMGQELFNPPNVKGWPGGRSWIGAGTLAVRYHLPTALIDGKEPAGLEPLGFNRFLALPRDATQGPAMMARLQGAMAERSAARHKEGLKCRFRPEAVFPKGAPNDPAALVDALLARLVVTQVRPSTRPALMAACEAAPAADRPAVVARLILASPEYQMA